MNAQDALRAEAGKLAAEAAAAGDATSWFELLYQAAARGEATIPWASLAPHPHLVQWARGLPRPGSPGGAAPVSTPTCAAGRGPAHTLRPGTRSARTRPAPT